MIFSRNTDTNMSWDTSVADMPWLSRILSILEVQLGFRIVNPVWFGWTMNIPSYPMNIRQPPHAIWAIENSGPFECCFLETQAASHDFDIWARVWKEGCPHTCSLLVENPPNYGQSHWPRMTQGHPATPTWQNVMPIRTYHTFLLKDWQDHFRIGSLLSLTYFWTPTLTLASLVCLWRGCCAAQQGQHGSSQHRNPNRHQMKARVRFRQFILPFSGRLPLITWSVCNPNKASPMRCIVVAALVNKFLGRRKIRGTLFSLHVPKGRSHQYMFEGVHTWCSPNQCVISCQHWDFLGCLGFGAGPPCY